MPLITASANTAASPPTPTTARRQEVVACIDEARNASASTDTQFREIIVFDAAGAVYASPGQARSTSSRPAARSHPAIVVVPAISATRRRRARLRDQRRGTSTCTLSVHILKGTATGLRPAHATDGISMPSATASFVDTDGNSSGRAAAHRQQARQRRRRACDPAPDLGVGWRCLRWKSTQPQSTYLPRGQDADQLNSPPATTSEAETAYAAVVGNARHCQIWNERKDRRNELSRTPCSAPGSPPPEAGGDAAK